MQMSPEDSYSISYLNNHNSYIESLAVTEDGKRLVTADENGYIKIWSMENYKLLDSFCISLNMPIRDFVLCEGDTSIIYSTSKENKLYKININDWVVTKEYPEKNTSRYLVHAKVSDFFACYNGDAIDMWDIKTGELKYSVNLTDAHNRGITFAIAVSPDGKYLAYNLSDILYIVDIENQSVKYKFINPVDSIEKITFSNDSKYVLSSDDDGIVFINDLITGKFSRELRGHKRSLESIIFSKDNQFLYTSDDHSVTIVWDIKSFNAIKKYNDLEIHDGIITAKGDMIISGQHSDVVGFKTANVKERIIISEHYYVKYLGVLESGNILEIDNKYIKLPELEYMDYKKRILTYKKDILYIDPSNLIIDKNGNVIGKINNVDNNSRNKISSNNKYALLTNDNTLILYDIYKGKILKIFSELDFRYLDNYYFSSDNKNVYFFKKGSREKTDIYIYSISDVTLKIIKTGFLRDDGLNKSELIDVYLMDKSKIITITDDNIRVLDISSGKIENVIRTGISITKSYISSDKRYLYLRNSELFELLCYDTQTWQFHTIKVNYIITNIYLTPDNNYLIVFCSDNSVKFINTKDGSEILTLTYFEGGDFCAVSPDGYFKTGKNGMNYMSIRKNGVKIDINDYKNIFYNSNLMRDKKYAPQLTYTPTVDGLRLRKEDNINSDILLSLMQGNLLLFIEKGREDTIDKIKDNWIKVKSLDGLEGWVFGGYLSIRDK
jgi:WD40 repeat protein